MTKKHFEAFAEEAREWRRVAKQNEAQGDKAGATNAFAMAFGIESADPQVQGRAHKVIDLERARKLTATARSLYSASESLASLIVSRRAFQPAFS